MEREGLEGALMLSYSFSLDKERDLARGQHSTDDVDEVRSRQGFTREGDGVE